MATIENFLLKFKVEGQAALNNAASSVKNLGTQVSGLTGGLGGLAGGAVALGTAFAGLGLKAISIADELSDISDATGISAGALNNFKNSLVDAGGKAEDFSSLAAKLNQNVGDAAVGGEKAQKAFQKLGVYVTDAGGNVRNTGDILRDAIAKLAAIEDPATRASMAVDIFGKTANKLDFTKLNAANDFAKDQQIQQLAKYQTAIDNIAKSINDNLLTAFGKLAIAYNDYNKQIDDNEKKLNEQGKTSRPFSLGGPSVTMNNPPGGKLQERALTEEEKTYLASLKTAEGMQADHNREMNRLKKIGAEGGGGFGAVPEATLKAVAESEKRIKQSTIDANKNIALKGANDIQAIEINAAAEIAKARESIYSQERLTDDQKAAEFAAKRKEIQSKADNDIAKTRSQLNARIYSEEESQRQANAEAIAAQQKQFDDATKTAIERADAYAQGVMELEDQILLEQTLSGMSSNQASMYRQIAEEIKKRTDALRDLAKIENLSYEDRLTQEARIQSESQKAIELIKQRSADDLARSQSLTAGLSDAWSTYKENALKTADQVKSSFDNSLSGLEDAFVRFAQTGKLSFKDLANSILADLARIAFKKAVVGMASLFGFAAGGQVMADTPIIVGERGPEMFVPRSAGTIVPNNALRTAGSASGEGAATNVTYNIQAVDAQSFRSMVARDPSFIYAVTEQGRRSQPTRRGM